MYLVLLPASLSATEEGSVLYITNITSNWEMSEKVKFIVIELT